MAVLSVKEIFLRRECVFLQNVSTILQLIVATYLNMPTFIFLSGFRVEPRWSGTDCHGTWVT